MALNSDVSIKPFSLPMLEQVWSLRLRALRDHPASFGEPYATASLRSEAEIAELAQSRWTGGDNRLFIAVSNSGDPVGMLGIVRETRVREHHRMSIWGVYVDPAYRGQRISSGLMNAAIDYARSVDGVLQVHLIVQSNNHVAIRGYERATFWKWGTMPRADILDGVALDYDFMVCMLD